MSQRSQVSRMALLGCSLNGIVIFIVIAIVIFMVIVIVNFNFGQVMSPHPSDQISQRSQVSRIAL